MTSSCEVDFVLAERDRMAALPAAVSGDDRQDRRADAGGSLLRRGEFP